jgi:alpha-tubulin suppressor-like RCC1 family protein
VLTHRASASRVLAFLTAIAAAAALTVAVPALARSAHAATSYKVSAAISAHTITLGKTVIVHGKVHPAAAKQHLQLQAKYGKDWHTITTAKLPKSSSYRIHYKAPDVGGWKLRVRLPATKHHHAAVSKTLALTVHTSPAVALASDDSAVNCVVVRGGTVQCWGSVYGDEYPTPFAVAHLTHVTEVAENYDIVCAIVSGGHIECLGNNALGDLGNGSSTDITTYTPVRVKGISTATAITASNTYVCALLSDHTIWCWGDNNSGQLGSGSSGSSSSIPEEVSGIQTATSVAAGTGTACATLSDGSVDCWGAHFIDNGEDNTPQPVTGLTATALSLGVGGDHACALMQGGTLDCWGTDGSGQLGDGQTTDRSTAAAVTGVTQAVHVASGYGSTCALLSTGHVECWGTDAVGQLGNGTTTATGKVTAEHLSGVTSVVADYSSYCALTAGRVKCWGSDGNHELGDGAGAENNVPSYIAPLIWGITAAVSPHIPRTLHAMHISGTVTPAAAGRTVTLLRWPDGATAPTAIATQKLTWHSRFDFTFRPKNADISAYVVAVAKTRYHSAAAAYVEVYVRRVAVSLSAGHNHDCAADNAGDGFCWGSDNHGELGYQGLPDSTGAYPVTGVSGIKSITSGYRHSCALLAGGQVDCWGDNSNGQLGDGSMDPDPTFGAAVRVKDLTHATAIGAGEYDTCAIISNGEVKCWGVGSSGQLGNGAYSTSDVPVTVTGISSATAVTVGFAHACALLKAGAVKCWGSDNHGQLGRGSYVDSSTPVAVTGLTHATTVTAGYQHTCALLANGNVKCWGDNDNGELGTGDTIEHTSPVTTAGVTKVVSLSAGGFHTCAALASGHAVCWGQGNLGELGDGHSTDSSTPVTVAHLTHVLGVSAGFDASCAFLGNPHPGDIWCWGNDADGQAGTLAPGTTDPTPVPLADQ